MIASERREKGGVVAYATKDLVLETSERVSTKQNTNSLVTREIEGKGSKLGVAIERNSCSRIRKFLR